MNRRKVVADSPLTRVESCPCGGCQLTIGPVTVSVHESLIEELAETLALAMRAIRAQRALRPSGAEPEPCVPSDSDAPDTSESN